ncbi:pol protein [Cucumis melo var. makuwa]|uniref:Pol protein n=1 Tax=Cucumis melo var. makuwa TaxID=1194695 RepID=A0A5D3DRA6_CUCMM|nr:pol protein [Cucumis melo var. makuwa]
MAKKGATNTFDDVSDDGLTFDGRLCGPEDSAVKAELLTEAHSSPFTMHPGSTKMYQNLRRTYWWRNMKREVAYFVSRCLVCQQVKAPRQKPAGLLQPLGVPEWKWESTQKSAHFVPEKFTYTASKWGQLYMTEIVRLHEVPVSIISDRDARFTSKFWKGLQLALGTRLDFSTTFHPQTDGQTERLNQILKDMLRACVLEFSGSWDSHLHLMEFAYNNNYQTTIGVAPFEALYGKCCRSLVCWGESRQKSYADKRRKDLEFEVGDMVFLKVAPMKGVLRFEKKGKLMHDVFHVSMLRRYVTDPTHVVDFEPLQINEDLSYEEQPVEILAREPPPPSSSNRFHCRPPEGYRFYRAVVEASRAVDERQPQATRADSPQPESCEFDQRSLQPLRVAADPRSRLAASRSRPTRARMRPLHAASRVRACALIHEQNFQPSRQLIFASPAEPPIVNGIIVQGVAESQCDISAFSYASVPRPKISICTIGERGGRLHHTASLSADSEFRTADLLIKLNKCRTIVLRSYDCDTKLPFSPVLTHIFRKLEAELGICPTKSKPSPTLILGAQIARVQGRASSRAEAEVRTRASWQVTRSDRGRP